MSETITRLQTRIYLQRGIIGFLCLFAGVTGFFSIRAGRDLDTYWWHVNWVERIVTTGERERAVSRELNRTVRDLFQSLQHCACEGDPDERRRLWDRFMDLLHVEEQLARQTETLFREYERQYQGRRP